jgi:hypothetical protein
VESFCECGYELLGSIKCWETTKWLHNCGLLSSSQFRRVSLCELLHYYNIRELILKIKYKTLLVNFVGGVALCCYPW